MGAGVGASAALALLVSAPEIGVDSILLSWKLLGPQVTIARVAAVEDREGWRVARAGFGPGAVASPADAARALRAALRTRNLAALLHVLSARARGSSCA